MGAAKVLILEDDTDLCLVLAKLIERNSKRKTFAFLSVKSMMEARDQVLACDTAFLDVELGPDQLSGIEAFRWLREQGFRGQIFFLTGHGRKHPDLQRAMEGAATFAKVLTKPIAPADLVRLLEDDSA